MSVGCFDCQIKDIHASTLKLELVVCLEISLKFSFIYRDNKELCSS